MKRFLGRSLPSTVGCPVLNIFYAKSVPTLQIFTLEPAKRASQHALCLDHTLALELQRLHQAQSDTFPEFVFILILI